jgi:Tol biopolymer transport system component
VPLDSTARSRPYLASIANETSAIFSPDSKWVAIVSDQSGRNEVFIRSFPNPSAQVQISNEGGTEPTWSADGSGVYYRTLNGSTLIKAKLATSPSTRVIARDTLVRQMASMLTADLSTGYDVTQDGRVLVRLSNSSSFQLVVVPNWRIEMERRLAAAVKR